MNDQDSPATKQELLNNIRNERKSLEATLGRLYAGQMLLPLNEAGWTVKDILAHIAAWEQRMVAWVAQSLNGEIPPVPGSWDEIHQLNAQTYNEMRDRPLAEVRSDFQDSFQAVLSTVENLSEKEFFDPDHFAYRQGRPLWIMVAANTWWHYQEHNQTIQQWMDSWQADPGLK